MPNSLRRSLIAGLAAAIAVATPLIAQQAMEKPGARDASRVTAGSYTADPYHTMVGWRVDHMGITPYFGQFGEVTGTLRLDPRNVAATKVDITIPVGKVTTASAGLTAHLIEIVLFAIGIQIVPEHVA